MSNMSFAPIPPPEQRGDGNDPFMRFWETLNTLLESRGQLPLLYGEVHKWWAMTHETRHVREL